MRTQAMTKTGQAGVMLLEALIAILIFSIGILAVIGMQANAVKAVGDSRSRSEAAMLANQLLAQMWTDSLNVGSYAYAGAGAPPARLANWVNDVNKLPGAANVPPVVVISNITAKGADVRIQVFWRSPEETSQGMPPHNYTVTASVYGN